ncbi:MAG: four helix bundle protein [Planctomycetes bacterium]|nr:four helix bundle protein [Planctomycetota bacterium]
MEKRKNHIKDRTFEFSVKIVKFYFSLLSELRYSGPAKQLLDAGTSIGANVEEAQGGLTKKDFIHCINIAKKESRETIYWLKIWVAVKLFKHKEAKLLLTEVVEIKNILTAIVKSAQSNK